MKPPPGRSLRHSLVLGACVALLAVVMEGQAGAGEPTNAFNFTVRVHLQDVGDMTYSPDAWAGTKGQSKRLEGLTVFPDSSWPACLELNYLATIAGVGDVGWVKAGTFLGTVGQKRAIEKLAFKLTGSCAASYTVEYRAHIQDFGDTGWWGRDGFALGNRGSRLEAFQLAVHKK